MAVNINSKKVVQLPLKEYDAVARGTLYTLPNNLKLNTGDQIIIKEHTGRLYTGREIIGQVTESSAKEFRFRKYVVLSDEGAGAQNKRDGQKKHIKRNKFNAYI